MAASMVVNKINRRSIYFPILTLTRSMKRQRLNTPPKPKQNVTTVTDPDLFYEDFLEEDIDNLQNVTFSKKTNWKAEQYKYVKSKILEKKEREYLEPRTPNLLTWAARAQIKYLNEKDPHYWTPDVLAKSFPVSRNVIIKILRSKRRPRDEYEIYANDQKVYKNWLQLKKHLQVEGGPIDPKYRVLVEGEKLGLMVNAAGAITLPMPDLKKVLQTQNQLAERNMPNAPPVFTSLLQNKGHNSGIFQGQGSNSEKLLDDGQKSGELHTKELNSGETADNMAINSGFAHTGGHNSRNIRSRGQNSWKTESRGLNSGTLSASNDRINDIAKNSDERINFHNPNTMALLLDIAKSSRSDTDRKQELGDNRSEQLSENKSVRHKREGKRNRKFDTIESDYRFKEDDKGMKDEDYQKRVNDSEDMLIEGKTVTFDKGAKVSAQDRKKGLRHSTYSVKNTRMPGGSVDEIQAADMYDDVVKGGGANYAGDFDIVDDDRFEDNEDGAGGLSYSLDDIELLSDDESKSKSFRGRRRSK